MSHHYLVSVQQPTIVTHCIKGHFFSPQSLDVIIAKASRLEMYSVTDSGLFPMYEVPVNARISALCRLPPDRRYVSSHLHVEGECDRIVVYTEDYSFTVLE